MVTNSEPRLILKDGSNGYSSTRENFEFLPGWVAPCMFSYLSISLSNLLQTKTLLYKCDLNANWERAFWVEVASYVYNILPPK